MREINSLVAAEVARNQSQTELMRHFLYGNGNDKMGDQELSNEETWHAAT